MPDPGPPIDDVEIAIGEAVGPYEIDRLVGRGGMGYVFRARHSANGQTVALKVLKPALAADTEYTRRFLHEARAACEVHHPNLVDMLDFGERDGHHYLAMRYLSGKSLTDLIRDEGALEIPEILRICTDVGAGLDELHSAGLVHRDVKSANIVLEPAGGATLTDFGLAKGDGYSTLTRSGQIMGTIEYMAPELIVGERASPRSDIYSLGCVVHECLAARTPFSRDSVTATALAVLREPPPNPCGDRSDCAVEFSLAVRQALAKDPAFRPPSAGTYIERLRQTACAES